MKGIYELRPSLPRYTATWELSPCIELFPQKCIFVNTFFEGVDFKASFFLNPFEWTKVSDIQILFNQKYGALRP